MFKINRIVDRKIMDESFNCKTAEKIDFRKDFVIVLFSSQDPTALFEIILEYDDNNEFFLTDKIDIQATS